MAKTTTAKSYDPLLDMSPRERIDQFKNCWAAHKNILEAKDKIMRFIREPANIGVIYLIGPTGVGKSTLLQNVMKVVYEEALSELEKRPGWIPGAYMLAKNPANGVYNWTEHFTRTMEAVQEVLIERKIYIPSPGSPENSEFHAKTHRPGPQAVRQAAESALKNRGCAVFIVDDAHYIGKRRSGEQLSNQADTIKSVAEQSATLHLLAGTYDLLPLRNLNGQLGRKSFTVHLSNYKYQVDDIEKFVGVMKFFTSKLPLAQKPDFSEHWEFCYTLCAGCIGVLKDWYVRSLSVAIRENGGEMSFELFNECKPDTSVSAQIAKEIIDGEETLNEDNDETLIAVLRERLKINDKLPTEEEARIATFIGEEHPKTGSTKKGQAKKPGKIETKPRRLPVGLENDSL